MAKKKNRGQLRVLEEIKTQLILQAKRWGKENYYTPDKLEEMENDQCRKILSDLLTEKINLEYEAHLIDCNKREIEIKLEKLNMYIKKSISVSKRHEKNISRYIDRLSGDQGKIKRATDLINRKPRVSVLLSEN